MDALNNSFALLIGVYDPKLPTVNDATDIRDVLINPKLAGYPPENVFLLTNKKATRAGILKAFDKLIKKTNVDSKVFLYYSGHGAIDDTKKKASYYLQAEGWDINEPDKTGIESKEIKAKLNQIVAERLIFFFDCCHAQGMTKGSDLRSTGEKLEELERDLQSKNKKLKNPENLVHDFDNEEGMAIISACKDNQESLYFSPDRNSLFTTYLLKVLKSEHKTSIDSEYIKILDVASYLVEEVPKDAARDGLEQNPFVNLQIDKNFELSRVPKEKLKKTEPAKKKKKKIAKKPIPKKEVLKVFRQTENANNAILFVHGFSGESHKTFGQIPDFLAQDEKMKGWDMYPFGFNPNVNPQMGKEVWATVQDITRIADNLSSAIKYKFENYDRIAIVSYSLGGLVAQKAILDLNDDLRSKISHVLLIGSPNNGIDAELMSKSWNIKYKELSSDGSFITTLRKNWKNLYNNNYPFALKVVAATNDQFVTTKSCYSPFDEKYYETVDGNHFSMVSPKDKNNDCYNLILDTLTGTKFYNKFTNREEINLTLGKYDAVIKNLMPNLATIDPNGLKQLIFSLEGLDRGDEALQILNSHPLVENNSDVLGIIGGRYKRNYLNTFSKKDGDAAFNYYNKALEIAVAEENNGQIYYHAINLAFLSIVVQENESKMLKFAQQALDAAIKSRDNLWKIATVAEANMYLDNMDKAKEFYAKASEMSGIREKISIHTNAYAGYTSLMQMDNPDDDFIQFLKASFLS